MWMIRYCIFVYWSEKHPLSFKDLSSSLARRQIAPPTRTSEVTTSWEFELAVWCAQPPKHLTVVFKKSMTMCFFFLMSLEACLYTGADWLSPSVNQRVVRGQLLFGKWLFREAPPSLNFVIMDGCLRAVAVVLALSMKWRRWHIVLVLRIDVKISAE